MGLLGRSEETKGKHELELEKELALRRSGKHPKDLYNKGMHLQGPDGKPALGPDRKPVKLAMDGLPLMEFLVPDKTSATGKVPWDPKKHDRGDPKTDVHLPEPTPRVALVPHPTDPSKAPTKIVCKPMVLAEDGLPLNVLTAGAWVPRQGADGKPLKKLVVPTGSGGGDHHEVMDLIDDPGGADLRSFVPKGLECLNNFIPPIRCKKPKDMSEVLGMAGSAPSTAQTAVLNLSNMKTSGPGGLNSLAVVGGGLVIFGAGLNFLFKVFSLGILHMFFSFTLGCFGAVILALEQKDSMVPKSVNIMIEEYFMFLTLISGRGLFYLYVGCIQAAVGWKSSTVSVMIGFYMIFVGYMYLKVGRSVEKKLAQLQGALHSPAAIEHAFTKFDADGSGFLDLEEVGKMLAVLGSTLPSDEAMIAIDKNKDGKISRAEFIEWMARPDDH